MHNISFFTDILLIFFTDIYIGVPTIDQFSKIVTLSSSKFDGIFQVLLGITSDAVNLFKYDRLRFEQGRKLNSNFFCTVSESPCRR